MKTIDHNPMIIQSFNPDEVLYEYYSKSELRRLKKQGAVQYAYNGENITWIKIGKQLFIFTDSEVAYRAQVWWEYHFQYKPKDLEWKNAL